MHRYPQWLACGLLVTGLSACGPTAEPPATTDATPEQVVVVTPEPLQAPAVTVPATEKSATKPKPKPSTQTAEKEYEDGEVIKTIRLSPEAPEGWEGREAIRTDDGRVKSTSQNMYRDLPIDSMSDIRF